MNTTKMAEISEIISSMAIVITLIVLIFEVRNNTDEMRASTLADIAGRTQQFTITHMTNPQVGRVWNMMQSGENISDADSGLLHSIIIAALKISEESYIAYRDGRLDEDIWQTRATLAMASMRSARAREIWNGGYAKSRYLHRGFYRVARFRIS